MIGRRVLWSAAAQRDLDGIVDYIADQQPLNALKVFGRLQTRVATLGAQNLRGRRVPELRKLGIDDYRELIETPWRIIYRPSSDGVVVLALLDARRDLHTVLLEHLLER